MAKYRHQTDRGEAYRMLIVIVSHMNQENALKCLFRFVNSPLVSKVIVTGSVPCLEGEYSLNPLSPSKYEIMAGVHPQEGRILNALLERKEGKYLLFIDGSGNEAVDIEEEGLQRFAEVAETVEAGIVYSDYGEWRDGVLSQHPLNDYQTGSIRDDFEFGSVLMVSIPAANEALKQYGHIPNLRYAGLYDLRLKISISHPVFHIQESLYTTRKSRTIKSDGIARGREPLFDYVAPENREVQSELEAAATQHLKHIGAYLQPCNRKNETTRGPFPVEASVIIPVKNRAGTIAEAISSALSQQTNFEFNVIVIDNHSTDGTGRIVSTLAKDCARVIHIVPHRLDLEIGGCWNAGVSLGVCGRYSVQLDSDDLYSGPGTLQKIVNLFRKEDCAMVIGSYMVVGPDLREIPPGLVDHSEWTEANGRNNALRINGLGAPRAFLTEAIRNIGFLNTSYGEDYAMVLRISREFRVGRIYETLYLCRRWEGNTDALISLEARNRNNAFKDQIRTLEILARKKMEKYILPLRGDSVSPK